MKGGMNVEATQRVKTDSASEEYSVVSFYFITITDAINW